MYLPIPGFTEAICPYVPLSHPEAIEEAGPGSRYIAGVTATRASNTRYTSTMALLLPYYGYAHLLWQVTNSIFESAMRDRYDAIGVFSSGVVTLSAEVTAQHKIKVLIYFSSTNSSPNFSPSQP